MKTAILKGLEPDIKAEVRGLFKSSLTLRKQLVKVLETKVSEHFRAQYNRDNYDNANWAYAQADSMGYVRGLREVISLLSEDTDETMTKKPRGRPRKDAENPSPLV
tara:strand:- start:410 stop:727 length:318 start_codon:yes stop_codon:yes gene_type:complete